jgi:RNA polymerase sigma-70 factor, ECF subfamily
MPPEDRTAEFLRLWNAGSRQVYSFILSILPNWADADDAFQETGKVLWDKFGEFRPGSNFMAWACRIAFLSTMELRRRKRRGPRLFSDAFAEAVERGFVQQAEALDARQVALAECMEKLSPRDRDLLRVRYEEGATTASAAARVGRSINAAYKAINRIHEALFHCIERTLRHEGNP